MAKKIKDIILQFIGNEGKTAEEISNRTKLSSLAVISLISAYPELDYRYVNTKSGIQCEWFKKN